MGVSAPAGDSGPGISEETSTDQDIIALGILNRARAGGVISEDVFGEGDDRALEISGGCIDAGTGAEDNVASEKKNTSKGPNTHKY